MSAELLQGLYVSGMAMVVVSSVLAVIALLMFLLGRLIKSIETGLKQENETQVVPLPSVKGTDFDEESLAAVMAAISVVMKGKQFRVAKLAGYDVQTARWAMAGRQRLLRKG